LALSFYLYESPRMSSFQEVESGSGVGFITLAGLALFVLALAFFRSAPNFLLHRRRLVGITLAVVVTACYGYASGGGFWQPLPSLLLVSRVGSRLGVMLLLLCWAEALLPLGARRMAIVYILATVMLGCLAALTAMVRTDAANILVSSFPLISISCLYWYKDKSELPALAASASELPGARDAVLGNDPWVLHDQSLQPTQAVTSRVGKLGLGLVFLAPLACYPLVFGYIHYSWVAVQDMAFISMSVQLAAATGTVLGAGLLLLMVTWFWSRRNLALYGFIILPIAVLAAYMVVFVGEQNHFLYVVPLNIAQKLAFFMVWITPFLVPSDRSPIYVWGVSLSLYYLGKAASSSSTAVPDAPYTALLAMASIVVLIICNIVGILLDRNQQADPAAGAGGAIDAAAARISACEAIAGEHGLTPRELDVLLLLAEGLTAQAIAQSLVVSPSTAKSHIRNIYQKLDVHTQAELLVLLHRG
jgi:DNA-binding CsgD family transcriptional regulator